LNNEFSFDDADGNQQTIVIPPSLLISAMGQVDDVERCVTMDLKTAGNTVYAIGLTRDELGGSHLALVRELSGGQVPTVDLSQSKVTFARLHAAILAGQIRACHDLSEGGLAAAAAEMALAGGLGLTLSLDNLPVEGELDAAARLFSESNTRFLCEVAPDKTAGFEATLGDAVPLARVGEVNDSGRLVINSGEQSVIDAPINELKEAWQRPLRW